MSGGHHVGFEQRALQVDVMVGQSLVAGGENLEDTFDGLELILPLTTRGTDEHQLQ